MFGLGFQEVILLLLVALLLFGAKKLPDIGRAIGRSIREFKKAFQGEIPEDEDSPNNASGKKK